MNPLTYEETLAALLGFIGQSVSVIVGGTHNKPADTVLEGTLERGSDSPAMRRLYAHLELPLGEHTLFLVGGSA